MLSVIFLPRQFQVMVVENVDERHLQARGLGVPGLPAADQPVRAADRLRRPAALRRGRGDADTFVLSLPLAARRTGAGAAGLHRRPVGGHRHGHRRDDRGLDHGLQRPRDADAAAHAALRSRATAATCGRLLLAIRRAAIVGVLLLGYLYFHLAGEAYALVSIGLISFAAVAQFAPAALGGMYWKGGTRAARWPAWRPASRCGSTR